MKINLAISESGSSKADWIFLNPDGVRIVISTPGFNPFTTTPERFASEIGQPILKQIDVLSLEQLYFFAAGINSKAKKTSTQKLLQSLFSNAQIWVDSDLMAACYATSYGTPGIVSILGTGSNCCYFDGHKICQGIDSLGWILGDEGGGVYLGKEWIKKYIYKEAPEGLRNLFYQQTGLDKQQILESIYHKDKPNRYLAGFTPFLHQNKGHPFIKFLIINSFKEFVENHLHKFDQFRSLPLHFVGSISYYFKQELTMALNEYQVMPDTIVQKPINNLEKVIINLSNQSNG